MNHEKGPRGRQKSGRVVRKSLKRRAGRSWIPSFPPRIGVRGSRLRHAGLDPASREFRVPAGVYPAASCGAGTTGSVVSHDFDVTVREGMGQGKRPCGGPGIPRLAAGADPLGLGCSRRRRTGNGPRFKDGHRHK